MKKMIGTSGWSYKHWNKIFYTEVPSNKHLSYYSKFFNSVEINTTFYHLPSTKTVKNWITQVPKSFCFSIKASRFITHIKRLKDCEESLKLFYHRIHYLKKAMGPILFQLPPSFKKDFERLNHFIELLNPNYRHVFEFRSDSWFDEEIYSLLKKHNIALCISDLDGHLSPIETPANFVYLRLHGPKKAYKGKYGKRALSFWVKKMNEWKNKKAVYLYFDNDEKAFAVQDAQLLKEILKNKKS